MKPKTWKKCPNIILEGILDNCELEYDHYEGSHVETVSQILANTDSISSTNELIIESVWNFLSDKDFQNMVRNYISSLERSITMLNSLLDNPLDKH